MALDARTREILWTAEENASLLQGRVVLEGSDIVKEAGGRLRPIVKEFQGIPVADELTVVLRAEAGDEVVCGVEVISGGP